jgi:hypothetical protein
MEGRWKVAGSESSGVPYALEPEAAAAEEEEEE